MRNKKTPTPCHWKAPASTQKDYELLVRVSAVLKSQGPEPRKPKGKPGRSGQRPTMPAGAGGQTYRNWRGLQRGGAWPAFVRHSRADCSAVHFYCALRLIKKELQNTILAGPCRNTPTTQRRVRCPQIPELPVGLCDGAVATVVVVRSELVAKRRPWHQGSLRNKRPGLSGRPPCKGVAMGVASQGGRGHLSGGRTPRVPSF